MEGIRDAVMGVYDVIGMSQKMPDDWKKLWNRVALITYGCDHPNRKVRILMDVPAMIDGWRQAVLKISTAHSKDDLDQAEYALEELFAPLLTAPVKQLREFFTGLQAALESDPQCPWFVWAMFKAYGETIVAKASDQGIRELKTQLAQEIAELVEQDVQPDIVTAITGALRWRDPETLTQIKAAVQAGEKPRLKGKESCLFLTVGPHTVML